MHRRGMARVVQSCARFRGIAVRNVARETQSSVLCSIATCLPRCPSDCMQMLAIVRAGCGSPCHANLAGDTRLVRQMQTRPESPIPTTSQSQGSLASTAQDVFGDPLFPTAEYDPGRDEPPLRECCLSGDSAGVAQACEVGSARGMSNGRVTCWVSPWVYFMSSCSQAREHYPRPDEPLLQN